MRWPTAGYGLMVNGIPDLAEVDLLLRHATHIDALAIIASGPRRRRRAAYRRLAALPHPLVVIEDEPQRGLGDTCTVLLDDGGGGAALAAHLLAGGARRFLFVAPLHAWPAVERREAGFAAALPPDAASSGSPATRPTMPASWRPSRRGWPRPRGPTPWPGPTTRSASRRWSRPTNAGSKCRMSCA